jgi:hypothetical protein
MVNPPPVGRGISPFYLYFVVTVQSVLSLPSRRVVYGESGTYYPAYGVPRHARRIFIGPGGARER